MNIVGCGCTLLHAVLSSGCSTCNPRPAIVSFHCLYTDDDSGVKEAWIEARDFPSAERLFNERLPYAGWYEIGAPVSAFGVLV